MIYATVGTQKAHGVPNYEAKSGSCIGLGLGILKAKAPCRNQFIKTLKLKCFQGQTFLEDHFNFASNVTKKLTICHLII